MSSTSLQVVPFSPIDRMVYDLPDEILIEITKHCDFQTKMNLRATSKSLYLLVTENFGPFRLSKKWWKQEFSIKTSKSQKHFDKNEKWSYRGICDCIDVTRCKWCINDAFDEVYGYFD
jgi:hypothetical protein